MSAQPTQAIARDLRKAAVLVEERHGKRRSLLRLEDDDSVSTESPSSMAKSRMTLGYREIESLYDGPLLSKGQTTRGHEFHWSIADNAPSIDDAAYSVTNQDGRLEGVRCGSAWASYVHVHFASRLGLARRFVEACSGVESFSQTDG